MKLTQLCLSVFTFGLIASEALAVTYNFAAVRNPNFDLGSAPGSATEFALSDEGATISGSFSFKQNADVVATLTGAASVSLLYDGPSNITIFGPGGTSFSASEGPDIPGLTSTGRPHGWQTQDAEIGAPGLADLFAISVGNDTDGFFLTLAQEAKDYPFGPEQRPGVLSLDDFNRTRLFVFPSDLNLGGFVEYRLTSLSQVPLPMPAVLLLSGLVGLAAVARRKQSA